jgi:sortase A
VIPFAAMVGSFVRSVAPRPSDPRFVPRATAVYRDGVGEPSTPELAAEPSPDAVGAPPRELGRTVVRGFGEVLITLGALLLLMVVYQLWWTNVTSAAAIAVARDEITQGWREAGPQPTSSAAPVAPPVIGTGFALLYVPRMHDKVWGLPILQGTSKSVLAQGAGHYQGTAMPGAVGNFAIAAHRSSHDEPFAHIDDLRVGDKVYVETQTTWYVYTLTHDDPALTPNDIWVIDPVPGKPGATPTEKLLTMTTCTPRYGSTGRWAWWGTLTATSPTTEPPPDGIDPAV